MLYPLQQEALEKAQKKGYVVCQRKYESDMEVSRTFAEWCKANKKPFARVLIYKDDADVLFDLLHTDYFLTETGLELAKASFASVERFHKRKIRGWGAYSTNYEGRSWNEHPSVRLDQAEPLIQELIRIYNTPGAIYNKFEDREIAFQAP